MRFERFLIKFRFERFTTWLSNQKTLCDKRVFCIKGDLCTKRVLFLEEHFAIIKITRRTTGARGYKFELF